MVATHADPTFTERVEAAYATAIQRRSAAQRAAEPTVEDLGFARWLMAQEADGEADARLQVAKAIAAARAATPAIPPRLREAFAQASQGEWYAHMDQYKVKATPPGTFLVNDQVTVVLCATGEKAAANTALIAEMRAFVAGLVAAEGTEPGPVVDDLERVLSMATEASERLHRSPPDITGASCSLTGAVLALQHLTGKQPFAQRQPEDPR